MFYVFSVPQTYIKASPTVMVKLLIRMIKALSKLAPCGEASIKFLFKTIACAFSLFKF
jgi:hypothetical protein